MDLLDLLWGLIALGLLLGLRAGCDRGLCDMDGGGMVDSLVVGGDGGQGLELGVRFTQVERELVRAIKEQSQVSRSRNIEQCQFSFLLTRLKNFEKELGLPPEEDEVVVVVLVTLRPLSSMVDSTTTVGSVFTTPPPCWLLMVLLYWLNWLYCCCSSALYWALCPLPVLPLLLCPPSPMFPEEDDVS